MSACVIFDVEIRDMSRYQDFMKGVKPALDAAGARYLARGGIHKVYEGDWEPRRIVVLEFPSLAAVGRSRNQRCLCAADGGRRAPIIPVLRGSGYLPARRSR
jgi:uncharacterized protein (DUF1330 family)